MDNTKNEALEHLLFWQWEYDRRHSPQSHTRKFEKTDDPWVFSITPCEDNDPDADALRYDPVASGHAYGTSDDIINALISKTFRPLYPPYYKNAPLDTGITQFSDQKDDITKSAIAYNLKWGEKGEGYHPNKCDEFLCFLEHHFASNVKLFSIDLSRPLPELVTELEAIYSYYIEHGNARPWGNDEALILHQNKALVTEGKIVGSLEARAIGLWIWDQANKQPKTSKRKLAIELSNRKGFDQLGKDVVTYYSRWHKCAEESIKSRMIKPVNG